MADFEKNIDLDKGLNRILDKIDKAAEDLHRRGEDAGEAIGLGMDDGIDFAVEKIKASSIKTEKAFKNLGDKVRKQIQQLTASWNGKDFKLKIDFSDIDMNSNDIQQKISKIMQDFSTEGLIEFDTKGSEQQFKNLIALYVKYQEKLNNLQGVAPNLKSSKDIELNLRQQLTLALKLKEIYAFLDGPSPIRGYAMEIGRMANQLATIQQVIRQTQGSDVKVSGDYNELADVLKEIQSSLKVISDTFKNENNSMKTMAENGKTSFESLSHAIVEVYNNLIKVATLVDKISQKDFNITNITQTGGTSSSVQAMQQLQELNLTDINKSVKGANTEMKLASVLAEMQEYIDKLIKINELRNQYKLGEWKDTFVSTQRPVTQAQTVSTPTNNTEAQQMSTLPSAVDEVTDAVDLKNAAFIKEQEIVDTSVEAEKTKLRELVAVITGEIGAALDDIKEKFAQSFVVPELDKNQLQTSFDEIYNKFVDLKDKIQTMQIDIDINGTNITTAIQEALYAKEIAKNYEKITSFDQVFDDFSWGYDQEAMNKFTNEILSLNEAREKFSDELYGKFVSKDGKFMDTDEMLSDLMQKLDTGKQSQQDQWVQVIVQAIQDSANNIVEAVKLILPKTASDNKVNEAELVNAFQTLSSYLLDLRNTYGTTPGGFFRDLQNGNRDLNSLDTNVVGALKTLGLVSNAGKIEFVMPDTGLRNLGVAIADQVVVSSQHAGNIGNISEMMQKLDQASQLGAAVPRILSVLDRDGMIFELQERAVGKNIASRSANNEFFGATPAQMDKLIHTFEVLEKVGLYPDFIGDNVLFDKDAGFSLIDLDTDDIQWGAGSTAQGMIKLFLKNLQRNFDADLVDQFSKDFKTRAALPPEQRLVDAANTVASKNSSDSTELTAKITPTMDEGAIAKLVDENVQKTPATIKVTPVINDGDDNDDYDTLTVDYDDLNVIDPALDSQTAVDNEADAAVDAAKAFIDAANAKKQFVEANKQVAESAKESAEEVDKEAKAAEKAKPTIMALADDTKQLTDWDKEITLQANHGDDPFALSRSKTNNVGDQSVRTIVESWTLAKDADGELTGELELNTVKIINDFKKRTDAITKENEKIKTAKAYLQKFLTQFDNKTMGKGSLLTGYQDLVNLSNSDDFKIDDIAKAEQMMSNLDAEYNKVVQSMRKGSSSMNPFVNAINSMDKMEDVLRGISLQFRTLNQQPDWLNNDVIDLYKQLDNLSAETDIYKFAEGFGNLKVSINSVTESIRQQRVEQKLALSDFNALVKATENRDSNTEKAAKEEDGSDWQQYYLDRAKEQQKIIDAIRIGLQLTDAQEAQLNAMSEKHALIIKDINIENNKIEEQKQKYEEIMRLLKQNHENQLGLDNGTLKVVDKNAYQQRLDNERTQINELIKGANLDPKQTKALEEIVKLFATLKVESSNIDLMSKKWMEQNILTDEAKAKIDALRKYLSAVTSGTELELWKKQWKELQNEMSGAKIDAKADKDIEKLIEDDRVKQVKEYIELLKLKQSYEKKAAREQDGSGMQVLYKQQIDKIQEKIDKNDVKAIMNQEEKNQLLAIEESHQRAILELKQKQKISTSFEKEDNKIQQKYNAGYLNDDKYNTWKSELDQYKQYLDGTVQADEKTIQEKRQLLTQLYDELTKLSNSSKSFFASGGDILPKDMWLKQDEIGNIHGALTDRYKKLVNQQFYGMETSIVGVQEKLNKLTFTVDDGKGSFSQYTLAIDGATGAIKLLNNSTKPTLTTLQKLFNNLKKDANGLFAAIAGGTSMHTIVQYMRQGIQAVRELDLALTELKKVTDETDETYEKFLQTAARTGSRIGSTLSNVTSATAEFAKLGYNIEQAASMAEAALVYTNVGDNMNVETASQSIISTLKAFGIEANNTMSIVDKFNEIGKQNCL